MGNCVTSKHKSQIHPNYSLIKSAIGSENKKKIAVLLVKLGTVILNCKQNIKNFVYLNKKNRAIEYRLLQILYEEKLEQVKAIIANPKKISEKFKNKIMKGMDFIGEELLEIENWVALQEASNKSSYSERRVSLEILREKYDLELIENEISSMIIRSRTCS